jgi:hypothetical protein
VEDAEEYRRQWTACMEKMRDNRLLMKAIQFRAQGRRHVGRPCRRWLE